MRARAKRRPSAKIRSVREIIEDAKRRIELVSCEEAARRLDGGEPRPVLIDVREEYEYEVSHIGGSVHICRGTLEMSVEHDYPDRATALILYCGRGDRSALAGVTLRQLGYRSVASIDGGLHAWQERSLPIVVPNEQRGEGSGI